MHARALMGTFLVWAIVAGSTTGCDLRRRVIIVTGTTLGMKATPGDGQSRPPQVTLGYKRAEGAVVPTSGRAATGGGERCKTDPNAKCTDAYSAMAAFDFRTEWFGKTELSSFVATGFAAREIQDDPGTDGKASDSFADSFGKAFENATVGPSTPAELDQRVSLQSSRAGLTEGQARKVLDRANIPVPEDLTAKDALQDAIAEARGSDLSTIEAAIRSVGH